MNLSIQALIKQHAFIVFVALAVLISWFPWLTGGIGFLVFGPSIAGVIMIAVTSRKAGLRDLGQRALRWRVGFLWWAVALFSTGFIILFSVAINGTLLGGGGSRFRHIQTGMVSGASVLCYYSDWRSTGRRIWLARICLATLAE